MSIADSIREYVNEHYVEPARNLGQKEFTVRAGDVHSALGLTNHMPGVCSALGSDKFLEECGLRRVRVEGPLNGSNCKLTFELL